MRSVRPSRHAAAHAKIGDRRPAAAEAHSPVRSRRAAVASRYYRPTYVLQVGNAYAPASAGRYFAFSALVLGF